MTIIVDRDLILKIDSHGLTLIFHPGWTRDQKILSWELKNSRIFLNLLFFREKRTTNIGKSWSNKYYVKISGQNQTLFEKVNSKKYWPKHYNLLLKPFSKRLRRYEERINRSTISWQKVSQAYLKNWSRFQSSVSVF